MPVSTCLEGNSSSEPSPRRLYWMKTRFQISITSGVPALTSSGPQPFCVRSKWISEHGPHGPVSPISQKLSFSSKRRTWAGLTSVTSFQIFSASSSSRNTVTQSRSLGSFKTPVSSSHAQPMASRL